MSRYLFIVFGIILTSCSQVTTPFYNDPLYSYQPKENSNLDKGAEAYTHRGDYSEDSSKFSFREDETYEQYSTRLVNTLSVQEYEKEKLFEAVEAKTDSIKSLKKQVTALQARHVGLRLLLMRVATSATLFNEGFEPLFTRYVIQKNDTLQKISYEHYGSYTGWLAIYRFNRETLKGGPNRIMPGLVIYIPSASLDSKKSFR
jgi:LysM repeat protein